MFSQTVEYALRTVVFLANRAPDAAATDAIAVATKVPPAYLAKVIQSLVKTGVLKSRRGVGGGVCLAKTPAELTILEVVNAVDPIKRIRTCPLGLSAHGTHLCALHKRVDNALATVEAAFAASTLADVLAEPNRSKPLCNIPALQPLAVRKKGA